MTVTMRYAQGSLAERLATIGGPRLRKLASTVAAGAIAHELVQRARNAAQERVTYTVAVTSADEIWPSVHRRVLELLPAASRRALVAVTRSSREIVPVDDGRVAEVPQLLLLFDGDRSQRVRIAGHRVDVRVDRPDTAAKDSSEHWRRREEKIRFTAYSRAAQQAVLELLDDVAREHHSVKRQPEFRMLAPWGEWRTFDRVADRPLSTVVLDDTIARDIEADVARFLTREDDYRRYSMPWHRGYLLHGPPGTGKTSLAIALASRFNLDVYYLPLGDLRGDTDLIQAVASVRSRSMLVIEDVDVYQQARDRDSDGHQLAASLSGMLNSLDGIATPHGLITVLTTNRIEALDAALVRAGRVDRTYELSWCTDEQLLRLWALFHDDATPPALELAGREISPATIVELLKRHLDDPDAARSAIADLAARPEHDR